VVFSRDTPVQAQLADKLALVERSRAWLSEAARIKNRLLYRCSELDEWERRMAAALLNKLEAA
jgi:hypothetical protein